VDRVFLDFEKPDGYAVVVDGMITDEPGPYTVKLTKAFDVESKSSFRATLSARRVEIRDNAGNREDLVEVSQGTYQTSPTGIQGVVGRAYTLRIELLDGRIYESKADSMGSSGRVDSVYFSYIESQGPQQESTYGFDVFFDSNAKENGSYYFLWRFKGTYQVESNPELHTKSCGESRCPDPLPCSGYIVGASGLEEVDTCECCTCWVEFYNETPIVSDNKFNQSGKFVSVKAAYVPINQWTFMYKVRAEISQMSLSYNAYVFWKAIRSQKEATNSIFQPITGKIPSNFVQLSGTPGPIEGIFYATSVSRKSVYITRQHVPNEDVIPLQDLPFEDTCEKLFNNSSSRMPDYWVE
jgi:hypothetical protein